MEEINISAITIILTDINAKIQSISKTWIKYTKKGKI